MANDYYNHSSWPATGAAGRSADARAEMDAIAAGFSKMASLVGNAYKIAYVNAGETAWDVLGGTGLLKLRTAAIPVIAADGTDYLSPAGAAVVTNKTLVVANNTVTTAAHGNLSATELNAALAELTDDDAALAVDIAAVFTELTNHLNDAVDAHDASAISSVPAGDLAATNVQAALDELATEKAPLASPLFTGDARGVTPALGDNDTSFATTAFVVNAFADGFGQGKFSFKNRVINGDMPVTQRGAAVSVSSNGTIPGYFIDRFSLGGTTYASGARVDATPGTGLSAVGGKNAVLTTGVAGAVGVAESSILRHIIEGFNVRDFLFGTAGAKTIVLSFRASCSVAASNISVGLRNSANNRSYVTSVVVGAADTYSVVIPGDTAGTWLTDAGVGISLSFCFSAGGNVTTAPGAWTAGNFVAAAGQTNLVTTLGATLSITDVQVELGSVPTPFETYPLPILLALCQRYYEKSFLFATTPAQNTGTGTGEYCFTAAVAGAATERAPSVPFKVTKRAAPSITLFNPSAANGQVRDTTAGADCSVANASGVSDAGFLLSCTGAAGTLVGNRLGVHWVAEADYG